MTNPVGIDISAAQPNTPSGDWLFIVHKATEGHDYLDPAFAARFGPSRAGAAYVGAYHYARPLDGYPGNAQADFFAQTCLAAGFRPGEDLWQLDCEGTGNDGCTPAEWSVFVRAFMAEATAKLGNRGFLYVGQFFPIGLDPNTFSWWLPDYGPNNGNVNPIANGKVPVIHQYSSAGALDRNVVVDTAKWNAIVGDVPIPASLAKFLQWVAAFAKRPLIQGDKGSRVVAVQKLLNRHGFSLPLDGVYDVEMVAAVKRFKIAHGISNSVGSIVGRECIQALVK